ncbi:MAG TPA: MarR family transcriptional regulator [Clostridiaceae bacterium]|nr:MarR family transcriptional regulator [Clostridiaceae bacterium]
MSKEKDLMKRLISDTAKMDGLYYLWGKNTGVSENMLTLMYALNDDKMHTQKQICEQFSIPKTTINTIVKELIEKGLIVFTNGENLKEKNLALTEKGKIYAEEIIGELEEIEKIALKKTLEKYSIEFIETFEYLLENMENEINTRLENKKGNKKKV